jgi:hypothetical protein
MGHYDASNVFTMTVVLDFGMQFLKHLPVMVCTKCVITFVQKQRCLDVPLVMLAWIHYLVAL